jgi:N-acyl-D-amino-acid deacylase
MYDLLIKNGRIYDGTGSASYTADVAVAGDEIVAIGRLDGEAEKTLDASGLALSPGFIDLHTHSDISFLLDPTAQSKVRQGVTLELAGNCGSSFCAPLMGDANEMLKSRVSQYTDRFEPTWNDFGGYLDAVEQAGCTLNLAVQVGHGTIRACVLGQADRAPSGVELDQMKALVAECLDAGAMGFSTGLFYAPGNYARLDEVIELAAVAAQRGKVYSTHMRDEGNYSVGLFVALNEAIEIGRRTGVRVEISHVKCIGPAVWGRAADVLELFERTRREGIDIAGDQYPYTAASTSLTGALFPRWSLDGGRVATLARMDDPDTRARMRQDIEVNYTRRSAMPEGVVIARYAPDPGLEGMNMAQVASRLRCDPAEAALELYEKGDGSVIVHGMQQADLELIARHPLISVASDGTSLSTEGILSVGRPHPRSYGTNPRYLAQMVREKRLVPLEEAIRKMTLLPATRLGMTRRGRIAPGFAADIVAFDPATVADTATFESPHSYAVGIPHVAVNGILVIEDGEFTGKTPGKVIRGFED